MSTNTSTWRKRSVIKLILCILLCRNMVYIYAQSDFFRSPTSQPSDAPSCNGAIACALEPLQIGPIEFCIDIPLSNSSDIIGLCVWDYICNGIMFSSLKSDYVSPHILQAEVDGLGVDCLGEWNVTEIDTSTNETSLLYEGEFSLDMNELSVAVGVEFANYSVTYNLPASLLISNCSVPAADFEVHFLGGAIGKALDITLAPRIEEGLEEHADELLCGELATALSRALSKQIQESTARRETTIDAGQQDYPPPVVNGTFDWRTSKLATLHAFLDSITLQSAAGGSADMAACLFNSSVVEGVGDNSGELLLNRLLNFLTNGTGEVSMPLDVVVPLSLSNSSTLEITSLTLSGLNSFSNFSLLVPNPTSGAVLSSKVGMQVLSLQLYLRFNTTILDESASGSNVVYSEDLLVTLGLSNVSLELDLVVALSETILGNIYVDQYLNYSGCVVLALQELSVSSLGLWVNLDEVSLTQISGYATSLEKDVLQLLDNTMEWVLNSWPVTELIAGIAQTKLKDGLNYQLDKALVSLQERVGSACPEHIEASGVDYLDWNSSNKLARLNTLTNSMLGPDGLNNLMSCVTGGTGQLTLLRNNSNMSLTLSGLDSFYEFALLYPLPGLPYDLGNKIALGQCDGFSSCQPFGLTLQFQAAQRRIYLDLEMQNVELFLDLLFMLDQSSVLNLNLLQAQRQGCVMTATEALQIQASSLHLTAAELYLDDGESEPLNVTQAVDEILKRFQEVGGLVDRLDAMLTEIMDTASARCDGTYDPSADDDASAHKADGSPRDWTWQIALLLVGCFLSLVLLAYLYQYFGVMTEEEEAYRDSMDIAKLCGNDSLQEQLVPSCTVRDSSSSIGGSSNEDVSFQDSNNNDIALNFAMTLLGILGYGHIPYDAIFASPRVPLPVRVLFPFVVVGCIAVTMYANIATGTSVMVELDLGDRKIEPPSVFDFALGNTVRDMWSAGVYPLAILIAFFSGAWPYIKLLAMLICWISPSAMVSQFSRGRVLRWLDILGKWSLIDAYVMVMMMVAFHVEMFISPSISIIITVVPKTGFNLFLLAVLMSLGLGHIAIGCHRMDSEDKLRPSNKTKESLNNHVFVRKFFDDTANADATPETTSRNENRHMVDGHFVFSTFGRVIVGFAIIGSIFLVIAGVFFLTFVFHFKGLVGFILGSDDNPKYSLITTGTTVSTATGNPNSFIVRWIQACFFGFGVAMPLLFLCTMLVAWVIPLRLSSYRKLVVFAEVANAWNAIDVFVVSVVAALFEIQQFAEFIIGDSCDTINEILEEKNPNPDGDNKCFDVTAGLLPKFWVLGLAAGIMMTFGLWLLRMAQENLNIRRDKDRGMESMLKGDDGEIMLRSSVVLKQDNVSSDLVKMPLYERNCDSTLSPESSNMSSVFSENSSMSSSWQHSKADAREENESAMKKYYQKLDVWFMIANCSWTQLLLFLRIIKPYS